MILLLLSVTFGLYCMLLIADPGFVDQRRIEDYLERAGPTWKRCDICCLPMPWRTRHCHECRRCVAAYDHHCNWIGQCVGEGNHGLFFLFLLFEFLLSTTVAYCFFFLASPTASILRIMFCTSKTSSAVSFLLAFTVVFITSLLCSHLYFLYTGQRTWELIKWRTLPYVDHPRQFDRGVVENLKIVFQWPLWSDKVRPLTLWLKQAKKNADQQGHAATPPDASRFSLFLASLLENKYYSCCG
jgi:palmitoyltransferase